MITLLESPNEYSAVYNPIYVDSSAGVTIWTYKGVLTREINWNQLSTDPRKHILKFSNRVIRY